MRRKHKVSLKMLSVLVIGLLVSTGHTYAGNPPQLKFRIYGTSLWNYGWGSKFFFHTGTMEDLIIDPEGTIESWHRVLHHYSGPNLEVCWAIPLSAKFAIAIAGKYQRIEFQLNDSFSGDSVIGFDWISWHKRIDARLSFLSLGARMQMERKRICPYVNADIGYCWVDLTTNHIERGMFSSGVSATLVSGRGGGIFARWIAGVTMRIREKISLIAEAGYLFCGKWEPIPAREVHATFGDPDENGLGQIGQRSLITTDRQISRIHGFEVGLGCEVLLF